MTQKTKSNTCKEKRVYWSRATAYRAAKRRNKAAGYKYLRAYSCDQCDFHHLTTQDKENQDDE